MLLHELIDVQNPRKRYQTCAMSRLADGFVYLKGAGTIHSDFERGFICAEVMHYDELKDLGSESAVKSAGKYRQEGKNYILQDGDICYYKFNVTASAKK